MKNFYFTAKILLLSLAFFSLQANAQAPQTITYQSVIRNSSNALLANTAVGIKISILQGSSTGTEAYAETQTATTNTNGLVSLQIGAGTPTTGTTFAGIDWAAGPYFIKTETDPTGGSNYTITGIQQMASVPYALYAAKSGGTVFEPTIDMPDAIHNTNEGNVGIGTDLPGEKLDVAGNLKVRGTVNNMNVGNLGSGSGNVAFGNNAFNSNSSADDNTAIGGGAMRNITTGNNNVAVGSYSLGINTTGFWNNAIGFGSLGGNTTGYQNIGLGFGTLGTNTTGYQNTAIGNSSNVAAGDLNNATAIGNGALVDASNKIQLGNTDVTSVNTSGSYTGAGFVKAGGTSSQFLMADGSVSDGILATITAMQAQITALQNQISGLIQLSTLSTVVIGTQKWTTKNLNVTTYSNGDIIPEVQDGEAWANLTTGAWCHLNNDPANDAIYGKMYNHYAVEDPRGLAPTGYHIPTQAEWFTLFETAGGWYSCSPKLRSTVFNGTDDYGFSVLNGGSRSGNAQEMWFPGEPMIPAGTFQTSTAMFWSSDVLPQYTGAYFGDWNATGTSDFPNNYGAYIRLIKN